MSQRITIDPPLSEYRKKLRAIDPKLGKGLQKVNKSTAVRVAGAVGTRYVRRYTSRSGRGRKAIRARATQTSATVVLNGRKAPYIFGQNFGSLGGPGKSQFPSSGGEDQFLYVTVGRMAGSIERNYLRELDGVMRAAFPKGAPLG